MDQNKNPQEAPKETTDLEEINLRIDKIDRSVTEVKKQFTSIQRSLDAIYEDRDLLADIGNDLDKIKELVIKSDKHQKEKADEIKETVEKKSEEVKAEVSANSTDVKQNVIKDVVKGVAKTFKRQEAKLQEKGWIGKIMGRLTFWKKSSKV